MAFQHRVRKWQPDGGSIGVGGLAGEDDALAVALDERVGDGGGRQQGLRVGMGRGVVHLGGRARLHDATEVHHGDPVAEVADDGQVVGDEQEAEVELGPQPFEQPDDLGLDAHVERRHRLVQHQQSGPTARALAMPMRWRCPPENWCG